MTDWRCEAHGAGGQTFITQMAHYNNVYHSRGDDRVFRDAADKVLNPKKPWWKRIFR